jgi:hypothetical protein
LQEGKKESKEGGKKKGRRKNSDLICEKCI